MNLEFSVGDQIMIFLMSALAIWYFCNKLSDVVEYIDAEFGLGSAFGGTLILAIVTNLPEIAITVSGSLRGNFDLVTGNLLGGIALQSMLLILYDFVSKDTRPLSTLTSSKAGIYQGIALIAILILCLIGSFVNEKSIFLGAGISVWMIMILWFGSLFYLKKVQTTISVQVVQNKNGFTRRSSLWWLCGISVVVLFFGVLLANSSDAIATHFSLSGVFFGATVLALVTSLPEISSGLEFVKNKDYPPIISDIFGGNGFLPVLFLPASIIAGQNIIAGAGESNNFLSLLSILITSIFITGMIYKSPNKFGRLGWDNWLILIIGFIGFTILYYIAK